MQAAPVSRQSRSGFTLIEILLTVVIIAILTGIVLVAIRPKKNLADAKDAQRRHDLTAMINALYQYQIDHDIFPQSTTYSSLDQIKRDVCSLTGSTNLLPCNFVAPPQRLPLGFLIPEYIAELPRDPKQAGNPGECETSLDPDDCTTGYQLWLDEAGRIHASAPLGNEKQGIELAR